MTKNNLDIVDKEIQELLEKNKMRLSYQVSFPKYRELPDEVVLAMKILQTHGMKITFSLALK